MDHSSYRRHSLPGSVNYPSTIRRRLSLEPLENRIVLDSTVVFNEIMYNPPDQTDTTLEWIELYNQMGVPMDLSGWSIDGGVKYSFAEGTVLSFRR